LACALPSSAWALLSCASYGSGSIWNSDFAAFFEQAFEHHAVDAGAHLRYAHRLGPGRQFGFQGDFFYFGGDDAHFRLRHLRACARTGRVFFVAASGQQGNDGDTGGRDVRYLGREEGRLSNAHYVDILRL
jgi:hypothetical protein